jgi:pimeloyl-ACP methyl ester carboxylesterase/DNA-binding CsgD family transcriptional regulator
MGSQRVRFAEAADGVKVAYSMYGEGRPLIFVARWTYGLDYPVESGLIEPLAREALVVGFDRRGIGASQREIGQLSLEATVSDVEAVRGATGFERIDLIGSHDGAIVAAAYAARWPERVRRLVLLSLCRSMTAVFRPAAMASLAEFVDVSWAGARRTMVAWALRGGSPEALQWSVDMFGRMMSPEMAKRYILMLPTLDCSEFLPRVSAPTLVVHRRDDASLGLDEARAAAALVPGSRLVVLEGSAPVWDDREAVAQQILKFLGEPEEPARAGGMTERETEILALLAAGRSNQQIARELSISARTVERHIGNIYLKIGAHNRAEATTYAFQNGIIRES